MADNIRIQTVDGLRWLRTTEEEGVHHPHHLARMVDGQGLEYSPGNPIPVALFSADGQSSVTLTGGDLNVGLSHTNDSITIWAHTNAGGVGSPIAIVVSSPGYLQVDVLSSDWAQQSFNEPPAVDYQGTVIIGIQTGSPTALVDQGAFAPFQFDSQGRLLVALGPFAGAVRLTSANKTSPFTLWDDDQALGDDYFVDLYRCSGSFTLSLLSPANSKTAEGRVVYIKNSGTGSVILSPKTGTIEMFPSMLLPSRSTVVLRSNQVDDWEIL